MPVVIVGLVLAFLIMLVFGGTEIDRLLLLLLAGSDLPRWKAVAAVVEWFAQPAVLLALTLVGALILAALRRWRDGLLLGAVFVSGWVAIWAAQRLTLGVRPAADAMRITEAGFPSTSAGSATIGALALAFLLTRQVRTRAWALAGAATFALAAGIAAIMLGHSWPSSVVGGWAFGLAWVLTLLLVARFDLGDGAPPKRA
jgi:undecaprenyl-diphosphatase